MKRRRQFSMRDRDDDDAVESPPRRGSADGGATATVRRKVRAVRVATAAGTVRQQLVTCPLHGGLTLEDCAACPFFRGYSLDPTERDSFATCSHPSGSAPSVPAQANEHSRAMRTCLAEVMREPVCVEPDLDVKRLSRLFLELGMSGAPVVDAEGRPIGVVSKTDVVRELDPGLTVRQIMTTETVSLPWTASLAEAVELMSTRNIHRIPVVSGLGRVIGVLSALDVTRWLASMPPGNGDSPGASRPAF